jgi:hypothetical protein
MPTHDPDLILTSLHADCAKLCFYPSCGNRSAWVVAGLDADVFVFSDKLPANARQRARFWHTFRQGFVRHGLRPILQFATVRTCFFRVQDKFIFLFFQDNSRALARIHDAGWYISTFVGICDGCMEGGNYSCVHDDPFLSNVLAAAADGMDYLTDHSDLLSTPSDWRSNWTSKFRHQVSHPSGWDFNLHSLLFLDEKHPEVPYKILKFPGYQYIAPSSSSLPLARLLPMRQKYGSGMLAHYQVRNRSFPAGNDLSAPEADLSTAGSSCSESPGAEILQATSNQLLLFPPSTSDATPKKPVSAPPQG